jgi:hypothetical protein
MEPSVQLPEFGLEAELRTVKYIVSWICQSIRLNRCSSSFTPAKLVKLNAI